MNTSEQPPELLPEIWGEFMNAFAEDDIESAMRLARTNKYLYSLRADWLKRRHINVVNGPITEEMLQPNAPRLHGLVESPTRWQLYRLGVCVESLGSHARHHHYQYYADMGLRFHTEPDGSEFVAVGSLFARGYVNVEHLLRPPEMYPITNRTIDVSVPWASSRRRAGQEFIKAHMGNRSLLLEECARRMITTAK
jgi:hypothetical protein